MNIKPLCLLIPVIIGITTFYIIGGYHLIDPKFVFWIRWGDPNQEFLGWEFFRQAPWSLPIGKNPYFGMEASTSIVFSDSIPLLAIFFKIFRSYLTEPFQYFGIWSLLCFILQGLVAWLLIGTFIKSLKNKILATFLFSFLPFFLFRLGYQSYMLGHFLILLAIYLNIENQHKRYKYFWIALLSLSISINFYLFTCVFALWIVNTADRTLISKMLTLHEAIKYTCVSLCVLTFIAWQLGYFLASSSSITTNMYGTSGANFNLIGLIDPSGWSGLFEWLFPKLGGYGKESIETFYFAGIGIIFLLPFSLFCAFKEKKNIFERIKRYRFLIVTLILLTCFAITNNIQFGSYQISIPIPSIFLKAASSLRSSGRMFLPAMYCLILFEIYVLNLHFKKNTLTALLFIACLIQVYDTKSGWVKLKNEFIYAASSENYNEINSVFSDPFWGLAASKYKNILGILDRAPEGFIPYDWDSIAGYAAKHHLRTNLAYLARIDESKVSLIRNKVDEQIATRILDPNSLYVLNNNRLFLALSNLDPKRDLFAQIDGFNVLAPNWKLLYPQIHQNELTQIIPKLRKDYVFKPTKFGNENIPLLISEGWCSPEEWGVWSCNQKVNLLFNADESFIPSRINLSVRAFLHPKVQQQRILVLVNGESAGQYTLNESAKSNILILIPETLRKPGLLNIGIALQDMARPIDTIPNSSDDRLIGIGLESVSWN
jgi:hypothetical protein